MSLLQINTTEWVEGRTRKSSVSQAEWRIRCDLAACYRLCHMAGWTDLIYTHISAALPGDTHEILLNPFGVRFDEVTASNLVKVSLDGAKLDDSPYDINLAGFLIHGAIHEARPEIGCVLHVHTEAGMAISMLEQGLDTRLSQHSARFHGGVSYHEFEGIVLDASEKARLVSDLGDKRVMVLRNHGLLVAGRTVAEAYTLMYYLERSARTQLRAAGAGALVRMSEDAAVRTAAQFGDASRPAGQSEWPALLRQLSPYHFSYDH